MIDIIPYGEDAVLVNFDQKIDESISEEVLILKEFLSQEKRIRALIPAYCSLTVVFDTTIYCYESLKQHLLSINTKSNERPANRGRIIKIPVCYDESMGIDLEQLAQQLSLSKKKLIDLHLNNTYHTYMLGFLPGFPYLGRTAEALHCNRLTHPRKKVAAGSVGLAGNQTGIYSIDAPGGWQIIGRTPLKLFTENEDFQPLIQPGDKVQFQEITLERFGEIEEQIAAQPNQWKDYYE